jgi:hypothetical protein
VDQTRTCVNTSLLFLSILPPYFPYNLHNRSKTIGIHHVSRSQHRQHTAKGLVGLRHMSLSKDQMRWAQANLLVLRGARYLMQLQDPSCSNPFQVTPLAGSSLLYNLPTLAKPGRNELEISAIKEHLDHISSLITMRLLDSKSGISGNAIGVTLPRFGSYPMDESIISRNWRMEFPFMTIQTPSMMCLLGINPRLAAQLVVVERTSLATLTPPSDSDNFRFQYQEAVR